MCVFFTFFLAVPQFVGVMNFESEVVWVGLDYIFPRIFRVALTASRSHGRSEHSLAVDNLAHT